MTSRQGISPPAPQFARPAPGGVTSSGAPCPPECETGEEGAGEEGLQWSWWWSGRRAAGTTLCGAG